MPGIRSFSSLVLFVAVAIQVLVLTLVSPSEPTRASGTTERVSVDSGGGQGDSSSGSAMISAGGRYVVFISFASNLVPGDTNGAGDVFVHDRQTGSTERVSIASDGTQGGDNTGTPDSPSISADGRFVAFQSQAANLVPDDNNGNWDVFVRDRQMGTTERVSMAFDGAEGNGPGSEPSISADGRYVSFSSYSTNLVPSDTNGLWDIFLRDRQAGTTERISVASDGSQSQGNFNSLNPSISPDGRYVVFDSGTPNLVLYDTNGTGDVFVRDRQNGTTERVSVGPGAAEGNNSSAGQGISADGRYVAFRSLANNLVAGDTNGVQDIFVHDRVTAETQRVSMASGGIEANGQSGGTSHAAISADGRFVTFGSQASNLASGDTQQCGPQGDKWNCSDVFVHDRQTGDTEPISIASDGTLGNSESFLASISADGRFVAFESIARNLVPGDTQGFGDVFVHDRGLGGTTPTPAPTPSPSPSPFPEAHTTLTQAAAAGSGALQVASTNNFFLRDLIVIDPGGPNEEYSVIAGLGSLDLAAPLMFAHQPGEQVWKWGASVRPGDTDCSGGVNSVDALRVLRRVASLAPYSNCWAAGNVSCLDDIDAVDALRILRYVAGLPANLPGDCPVIGVLPTP